MGENYGRVGLTEGEEGGEEEGISMESSRVVRSMDKQQQQSSISAAACAHNTCH
jgi:hypothetical protein